MKTFRIPAGPHSRLLTGIIPAARPFVLADRILRAQAPVTIVVCSGPRHMQELAASVRTYLRLGGQDGLPTLALLPAPAESDNPDDPVPERLREERECDRLAALTLLMETAGATGGLPHLAILTSPDGLFAPVPEKRHLDELEIRLQTGREISFRGLRERLATELDYDSEAVCERPGQFALRGGLIDVYPLNASAPVRLDFFGDELESIRAFDPTTQRSLESLDRITLAARHAGEGQPAPDGILSYLGGAVEWVLIEPADLLEQHRPFFEVFEKSPDSRPSFARVWRERPEASDFWTALQELETDPLCMESTTTATHFPFASLEPYRPQPLESTIGIERLEEETAARREFLKTLQSWQEDRPTRITALAGNTGRIEEIRTVLKEAGPASLRVDFAEGHSPVGFYIDSLPEKAFSWTGFPPGERLVFVSEREWLGRHAGRREIHRQRLLPHRTRVDSLLEFADLADGDYLVHLSHGICRYRGLSKMEVRGRIEEVISVEFAERVILHVPLQDAHLLTRYIGLSRVNPKLGKLGSNQWDKTRSAAEKATVDFAADMLSLQAKRAQGKGHTFSPDTDWQNAFENAFPFTETADQAEAIDETKRDMEKEKPMDRLVCGDVGFGKTEVAIRAAFKAVMDGFQVALMVPTTVLAQQHFDTFRERFAPYPVSVEMLSRFRSPSQQKAIVREIAAGKIDLVIGTHRLLGKDIRFANLGLLVIDEEHRFGVRHKERLKQFKTEVDVLSMSATPIPRTLYLALMGARDLSVIETPPADRLPIETLVRTYDPDLVKRAVERELERGGQVFYLHNRVQTIESVAARLNDLVPGARIAVGHGQMPEGRLEGIMTRFVAGESDILVCTTIIENGLDIPNCNTIIIEGADRFGLSQLYQLRGRVGRFKRQAYAYLLLHRHTSMLDLARKRLSAMRQHNQLGAGFRIAMRDLELRGAGNLLGHQQSGHIAGVGFDLYCQLLRQSIQRLKGEPVASRIRANVALDFIKEGRAGEAGGRRDDTGFGALLDAELAETRIEPVSAHLPAEYMAEARLRIDFYRQLAMADSLASVKEIAAALTDRFGKPPAPVKRLLSVTRIRVRAEMAGIRSVESEGNRLKCLKADSRRGDYIKIAGRFPRIEGKSAAQRLRAIEQFLQNRETVLSSTKA